jgi:hypothetical protein
MMTAILHFCTNDYRFLQRQIDELSLVCNQVIIPICDHFFNGEKENRELLSHAFQTFPKVQFLLFQYDAKRLYSPLLNRKPEDEDWATLWHSTSRYIGYLFSPPRAKYLLFIDADEIIEAKRFKSWLAKTPLKENAYWFSSYCYTRSAHLRTQTLQNTALLVKRSALSPLQVFNSSERFGIFSTLEAPKQVEVFGLDKKPMIHHYSWVRTEEEIRQKAKTWGKRGQKDWIQWMLSELDNQRVTKSVPYFDPLKSKLPVARSKRLSYPNVLKITPQLTQKREVHALL